ncbi:FecR family protein [Sphingobacterium faecale]|uniref:DUF4974 domain-containing protein n=1 Tax=Sphingobacterium faecale TaxID=2803775 RepID=A0ABS1QXL9_9SPHI|nr:FecR domain-containing protein [Sphingobacterium faecale]MBL1407172.1 DUF4974 domain-containing protein [Sphingobacterium faecale]
MENRQTLEELYNGYILGQLSAEELVDFIQQVQESDNAAVFEQLVDKSFSQHRIVVDELEGKKAFHRFQKRLQLSNDVSMPAPHTTTSLHKLWQYVAATAAILIMVFLGKQYTIQWSSEVNASLYQSIQDIKPGNTIAYIENTNGIQTPLAIEGELFIRDSYLQDGSGHILPHQKADEEWLNLIVPKGGKYSITLSDGSKVIINSDSKLSFPKHFTATDRRIKLRGEAYFEVSHNPDKPFIVETTLQKVRVLGTSFNIAAYPEERTVTTLITGKVNINTAAESRDLDPGMQGITTSGTIQVRPADLESVLAWKNDKFVFVKTPLSDIIKQLERWYNVSINLQPGSESLSQKTFSGTIAKDASFEELLKLFKTTEAIKVEVREGRIYLMK